MLTCLVVFNMSDGTSSLCLWQTVCVCDRQSVYVTDSLCLWKTVCVCHRMSVSFIYSLFLSQTVSVCHRQTMSVRDSLCLSQTLCPSQTICVCHRQSVSFPNSLFLSQSPVFFTDSLCLSQKVFCMSVCVFIKHSSWSFLAWFLLIFTWLSSRSVCDSLLCLEA